MPIPIDDDVVVTIRAIRTGGFTVNQISASLGLSLSTVSKYCFIINEARGHKHAYSRKSSGNNATRSPEPGGDPT